MLRTFAFLLLASAPACSTASSSIEPAPTCPPPSGDPSAIHVTDVTLDAGTMPVVCVEDASSPDAGVGACCLAVCQQATYTPAAVGIDITSCTATVKLGAPPSFHCEWRTRPCFVE